ncbi:MAG: CPBP family intramembrane glutamic endopeptidase [Bacillota bacterium]
MENNRVNDKRGIIWFLVLTFGLTWAVEFGVFYSGLNPGQAGGIAVLTLVMFFPALSAFIVRKFVTREGFGDAGLRVGIKKYYLAAWFGMPLMTLVSLGLALALGLAQWDLSLSGMAKFLGSEQPVPPSPIDPRLMILANAVGAILIAPWINIIPSFGEEFGWRGFLQVKLAHLGRFRAYLYTGLIWGVWHAPIIAKGHNYPDHPYLGIGAMIIFCVLLAFIFGWLRDASGSVWVAALAHGSLNASAGLPYMVTRDFNTLLGPALTGLTGWIVMTLAVAWLARRGAFGRAER